MRSTSTPTCGKGRSAEGQERPLLLERHAGERLILDDMSRRRARVHPFTQQYPPLIKASMSVG